MTYVLMFVFVTALAVAVPLLLWVVLFPFISGGLWATVRISPLMVLLAGPMLQPFTDTWSIGGVWVDSSDFVLALMVVVFLLRGRHFPRAKVPFFRLWLVLGIVTSLAYVVAPINSEYLTNPVRLAYQLYRYCWKPIIYYPLTALLLTDRKGFMSALFVAVAVADIFAIQATIAGYSSGMRASGPFGYGSNALGSALILPLMVALGRFAETTRRQRWFYGLSFLLILRGVIFTGSRGAMVGAVCGVAVIAWGLRRTLWGRRHLTRVARLMICLFVLVAITRGNPLERPSLLRFTGSDTADTGTFRWRLEERWPYFLQKVQAHPWLGVGTDTDLALGTVANTPHNGFLSIAVMSGVPALAIYLTLVFATILCGWRAFRRNPRDWPGATGLLAAAGVISVLVHNLVDTTVTLAFVGQLFWMLAAIAARMERESRKVEVTVAPQTDVPAPVVLRAVRRA